MHNYMLKAYKTAYSWYNYKKADKLLYYAISTHVWKIIPLFNNEHAYLAFLPTRFLEDLPIQKAGLQGIRKRGI